jgi:LmbE family N-acetylglucosaminyl deacetylase
MAAGGGTRQAMSPRRILVLVPHPDDEVVGCAVALRRAVAVGASPFALYLTTGVPEAKCLWPWQRRGYPSRVARRRAEAQHVGGLIGLAPVGFLDWPARSLKSHIAAALDAIRAAIAAHGIEVLWVPAWEGAHQDHDTANFLASRLAAECPAVEFAEYNYAGGRVRSGSFGIADGTEEVLTLTPEEVLWKRSLLASYASERGNLAHIRTSSEALRPLARHDYSRRPHDGTLFYERFQWVPFRHPRIDFERPETLCRTFAEYSAER